MTAMQLLRVACHARNLEALAFAMTTATARLGFDYYAITHHLPSGLRKGPQMRLHNYPSAWAEHYDRAGYGGADPVHRASQMTNAGFLWSEITDMIPMTRLDRHMLALGRQQGIGDGYTIPAHIPGEASGSVTFVIPAGRAVPDEVLAMAQSIGTTAFAAARRMWTMRGASSALPHLPLTDRQREVLRWIALGKSDKEIGMIMELSEETASKHAIQACERYGVNKRTLLVSRTLCDGTLTFPQILPNLYSAFPV